VPTATISRRAADRLRAGHLWVYRSDIEQLESALPTEEAPASLLTVLDPRGAPLGTALYSAASGIALRLISREPDLTRAQYLTDLRTRVEAALHLRATALAPESFAVDNTTNACRLIFSEADNLPGIVADRYAGLVILQLLTQSTAQNDVSRVLTDVLSAQPWCSIIVERPDPRIRELEQLPPASPTPLFSRVP